MNPVGAGRLLRGTRGCAKWCKRPSGTAAGFTATDTFNARSLPQRIQLARDPFPPPDLYLMYNCYSGIQTARECKQPVSQSGANNGDVIGYMYKDSRHTNLRHKAEFTYDSLNRLSSAIATPVSPGTVSYNLDFLPDRWGNTKCVTDGQTNGPCPNWTFDTTKNQINTSGFTYDAEGRLKSVHDGTTASYIYNALGQRVEKLVGSTYTEIVYGAFGQTLAFNNRSAWTDQFFYLGAVPFAKYQGNVTYFIHGNHLGSTTMVYNHTGGTVVQDEIFYPWGERWAYGGALYDERFASLGRRDAESTLDPTLFRMYESRLYRWLSPDPLAGDVLDPQSLNRYAYVLNNPTTLTDPLGLVEYNCSDPWYWASHAECGGPPPCVAYGTEGCIPIPLPPGYPRGGGEVVYEETTVISDPNIFAGPPQFPLPTEFSIADLLGLPDPFHVGPVLSLRRPSGAVVFQWPYYVFMAADAIRRCLMNPGCAARLVVTLKKGAEIARAAGALGAQTAREGLRQFGELAVGGDPRYWEEKLRIIDELQRSGQWETAGAVPTVGNQTPYVITVTGRR